MKKVAIISDTHCGHKFGLTPPEYWDSEDSESGKFQRQLWKFYVEKIQKFSPDILVVNGDIIEGKLSQPAELITADRMIQARMAADAINALEVPEVELLYGTRRHTSSDGEDYEYMVLQMLKAEKKAIHGHLFKKIEEIIFDIKHKLAGSTIPHGRFTSLARNWLWNVIWNYDSRQPRADIFIRSHVHYFIFAGWKNWLGIVTPAMTYNSVYGVREVEGVVDVGMIFFEVEKKEYNWWPVLFESKLLKSHTRG